MLVATGGRPSSLVRLVHRGMHLHCFSARCLVLSVTNSLWLRTTFSNLTETRCF